jgi:hypothetical protein
MKKIELIMGDCLEQMDILINNGIKFDAININNEIWKPILELYSYKSNWEIDRKYCFIFGYCFVSSNGRIYKNKKIIQNKPDECNNIFISMKSKRFKIHQIVLQTFIPNGIKDFITVDHINKNDRLNNSLENLRWANREIQYENRDNLTYKTKKVICHQNNKIYESSQEAEKDLGLVKNTVSRVARGDRKSIHKYTFSFVI